MDTTSRKTRVFQGLPRPERGPEAVQLSFEEAASPAVPQDPGPTRLSAGALRALWHRVEASVPGYAEETLFSPRWEALWERQVAFLEAASRAGEEDRAGVEELIARAPEWTPASTPEEARAAVRLVLDGLRLGPAGKGLIRWVLAARAPVELRS